MPSRLLIAAIVVALHTFGWPSSVEARSSRPVVRTTERVEHPGVRSRGPLSAAEIAARRIERVLRGPLRGTMTSLFVVDAETGERLFSVEPDARLNPASNVKLIATAAALELLGPEHRYRTFLLGNPPDHDGVIEHDLYLLGSYDPTLGRLGLASLADQLIAAGVTRLDGDIVVGEAPSRDGVFRSYVDLSIRAGRPGEPPAVTMTPENDLIEVVVAATTSRSRRSKGVAVRTEVYASERGLRRLRLTVSGQVGRTRGIERRVWISERALFAAHLLRRALRDAGVELRGDVHIGSLRDYLDAALARRFLPLPLAEHRSRPLAEIVKQVNKQSTNWLADRIIMTAAADRYGGAPSMETAITAMYGWLAKRTGLGPGDLVIDTGSGLSQRTAISSRQIVRIVRAATGVGDVDPAHLARRGRRWEAYRNSLAVGGLDGTLRHRFAHLDATVLGKTGTLRSAIALSGLLEVDPDRRVVFSIITNGHSPRRGVAIRRAQDRLVGVVSEYLRRRR